MNVLRAFFHDEKKWKNEQAISNGLFCSEEQKNRLFQWMTNKDVIDFSNPYDVIATMNKRKKGIYMMAIIIIQIMIVCSTSTNRRKKIFWKIAQTSFEKLSCSMLTTTSINCTSHHYYRRTEGGGNDNNIFPSLIFDSNSISQYFTLLTQFWLYSPYVFSPATWWEINWAVRAVSRVMWMH